MNQHKRSMLIVEPVINEPIQGAALVNVNNLSLLVGGQRG